MKIDNLFKYSKEKADCGKIMISLLEDSEIKNNMVSINMKLLDQDSKKLAQLVLDCYMKGYTTAITDVTNDFID